MFTKDGCGTEGEPVGRPEKPLAPGADPVGRLAHELRVLRSRAGSPSYQTMAKVAGFSATTLSRAASGKRLPSWEVVKAYVRACGADFEAWEPRWQEADAAVAGAVREQGADSPPYPGLARFEPDDQHLFFGRKQTVEQLERLMCDHAVVMLSGPSGSGKSSLLRAGLGPRLREMLAHSSRPAVVDVLTPGSRPATTHERLLIPADHEPDAWVLVDQFEEIFTVCQDRAERDRFVDLLLAARERGGRLRVLIAVRADFHQRCAEHRGLADVLSTAALRLGPMTADELRDAVVRPAAAAGVLVERELTARLVDEVAGESGGLPVLAHTLRETWRRRRTRTLTLATYAAAGGVGGVIASTAEEVFADLTAEQAHTAHSLLLRMVEPGRGAPDTLRRLGWDELREWTDSSVVLERLACARLLTLDEEGVRLAHRSLITCWPRLAGWLDEDRERLRQHRRLAEAARIWSEYGRDPADLYRGTQLARSVELFPGFARDRALAGPERQFLTASIEANEAEQQAAVRTARRIRLLVVLLAVVLAIMLVVALVAVHRLTR